MGSKFPIEIAAFLPTQEKPHQDGLGAVEKGPQGREKIDRPCQEQEQDKREDVWK